MNFLKNSKFYIFLTCLILLVIPFFWMKPGEMDLGGDGSRLYFYDPVHYLQTTVLYAVLPIGINNVNPLYLFLPFNLLLIGLILVLRSSYIIISLFNSFHLIVAFLSMYGITMELLTVAAANKSWKKLAVVSAFFVGLYYIFSPLMVRTEWDRALFTHARIFLSPLVFYLLLKFFSTAKMRYMLLLTLTTFIFSTNFSWAGYPSFFSFYPISLFYILLYTKFIKKIPINKKKLAIGILFLFLVHTFHLIPLFYNLIDRSGIAYEKTFSNAGKFDTGLEYFLGSATHITLSDNLLGLPQLVPSIIPYEFLFFFVPSTLIIGLILNYKMTLLGNKQRINYLLLFIFFLFAMFFATANITKIGFTFYKSLFNIPGFSMFRNYYGQWALPYLFFLSLLLGQGLFYILLVVQKRFFRFALVVSLSLLVIASAFPFIRGDMINTILNKGEQMEFNVPIKMDPVYEQVLEYIRNIPIDGKFFTFPHSESFNQVLIGSQGGMYIGPSTISHLAGKSDFNGYQVLPPFNEVFLTLAKEKDYRSIARLFGLLNVRYIFYNSDPRVLDVFPNFPYAQYLRQFLPDKQVSYKEFVEALPIKKDKSFGTYYQIYKLDDTYYLPHVYVSKKIGYFDRKLNPWGYLTDAFFQYEKGNEIRTVYLEQEQKDLQIDQQIPQIVFQKINQTKYIIRVTQAKVPYILVFSDAFHPQWKLFLSDGQKQLSSIIESYFDDDIKESKHVNAWLNKDTLETLGKTPIANKTHMRANAYANAWFITPLDTQNKSDYTLILEFTEQKLLYVFLLLSFLVVGICLASLLVLLFSSSRW